MESLLPLGVAAASIGLTYVMCIRPMRHGHCMMMPGTKADGEITSSPDDSAEIELLRGEIAALRGGPRHDAAGNPPTVG